MTHRLFYFRGSEAGRLVAGLGGTSERVPLTPEDVDDPEMVGPGVLVVEGSDHHLELAARFKATRPDVEVVVLADPANIPAFPSDQVYAYLPKPISEPLLAKTLANALAHIDLLHDQARAQADLSELAQELKELNNIGVKLSAERDTDVLLELILTKAREITRSDAGSLYLVEEDAEGLPRLRFKLAQNDSLNVPFKEFTLPSATRAWPATWRSPARSRTWRTPTRCRPAPLSRSTWRSTARSATGPNPCSSSR